MSTDVSGFKEGQKRMWSMGDYPDLAHTIESVAEVRSLFEHSGAELSFERRTVAVRVDNVPDHLAVEDLQ